MHHDRGGFVDDFAIFRLQRWYIPYWIDRQIFRPVVLEAAEIHVVADIVEPFFLRQSRAFLDQAVRPA